MCVSGGNSGGPLLDSTGHVVGVVSAKIAQASGMSFAIPAVELKALLGVLYARRYVTLPLLGLKQAVTTSNVREYFGIPPGTGGSDQSGLLIDSVMPESLLSQAGVRAGDVLLSLDGASVDRYSQVWVEAIDDRVHLDTFLARKEFYSDLSLQVWRGSAVPGVPAAALDLTVQYDSTPPLAVPDVPETVATPPQNVQFGGVSMVNLTTNLVSAMVNSKTARFLDPTECTEQHLIIVDVVAESPAGLDGTVAPGHLVHQVNGIAVTNIAQVCTAMAASQGDWTTIHTDRGMLILSDAEINEYECGGMGSFPTPHRLCSWACPEPEVLPEADAGGSGADAGGSGAAGSGTDAVTAVDDEAATDDAATTDADAAATDDVAAEAPAATNAFAPAVTAPQTRTLGLPVSTKPAKIVKPAANPKPMAQVPAGTKTAQAPAAAKQIPALKSVAVDPKAPAAVKAFKSKIQMVLP